MKKKILVSAFVLGIGLMSARANNFSYVQGHQAPVARNVLSTELPAELRGDIKKDFNGYWIAGLCEVMDKKHPSYILTLENADQVVRFIAVDSKNWVMTSTTIKEG